MSRSYRKPYASITGTGSAKDDKRQSSRGVRSRQNNWLRSTKDVEAFENMLCPHWREASWANVYDWKRDGRQRLQTPSAYDWSRYMRAQAGLFTSKMDECWARKYHSVWPPVWYQKLTRK